jgi:hypothetical protein
MEYIFVAIIAALLIERYFTNKSHIQERTFLMQKILGRSNRPKIGVEPETTEEVVKIEDDLTPLEDVLDDKFIEALYGKQTD